MFRRALLSIALLVVAGCEATFNCERKFKPEEVPERVCFNPGCEIAIQDHIKFEFDAAFTYLAMGAHFATESVNRPGLAKFLLGAASEERSHAILMLDYLNLRGIPLKSRNSKYVYVNNSDIQQTLNKLEGIDYKDALTHALNMEIDVTQRIYKVIKACEHDFHGADVFTNPVLDEQHDGVRKLQGAVKVFKNLAEGASTSEWKKFAEYTFDMKMLNGEIMAGH